MWSPRLQVKHKVAPGRSALVLALNLLGTALHLAVDRQDDQTQDENQPPGICSGTSSPENQLRDLSRLGWPHLPRICWAKVPEKGWLLFTWVNDPIEEAFVKEAPTEITTITNQHRNNNQI